MDLEAHIEHMVRLAMEDLQRNGVPVINQLLREARERPQPEGTHE